MGFKGPGVYEIIPYQKPQLSANAWGGSPEPGEDVRTYPRSKPPTDNTRWVAALVAGSGDDGEYIFINIRNGGLLAATSSPGSDSNIKSEKRSPTDPLVRWKLKYSPANGYDTWLVNGANGQGQLNVKGGSLESGANIIYWKKDDTDNARWYFDSA